MSIGAWQKVAFRDYCFFAICKFFKKEVYYIHGYSKTFQRDVAKQGSGGSFCTGSENGDGRGKRSECGSTENDAERNHRSVFGKQGEPSRVKKMQKVWRKQKAL